MSKENLNVIRVMKKLNYLIVGSLAALLSSCGGSTYTVRPVGELSMVATRNIDKSAKYVQLKAYAGLAGTDLEAAMARSKNGLIKTKDPITKDINAYKAKLINQTVDNVVKSVAGGEYLYNAKFFEVTETTAQKVKTTNGASEAVVLTYYVASGDVWGIDDPNANVKGFKKGDKVMFTFTKELKKTLGKNFEGEVSKQYNGKVINLKSTEATIQLENTTVLDMPYTLLTNLGAQ